MMNRTELEELIHNGENSGIEFKRDDVIHERLAKEMVAFLNLRGGRILLGVEKDGTVSGLTREPERAEEWVMEVARIHVRPAAIPYWETIDWGEGRIVGVILLPPDAPDKPYKAKRGSAWMTQVRVGSTSRDATDEEESRLYQQAARIQYGLTPVARAGFEALDQRRLRDYFLRVLGGTAPEDDDWAAWERLLSNLELMTSSVGRTVVTVDGMLLFGSNPKRYLPQSGIRAICYPGTTPQYAARADEELRGAMVLLGATNGAIVEPGLVEQALDFVRRNTTPSAHLDGGRRVDRWEYPEAVLREVIVNALVHRDYSVVGADIQLVIYSDRLEVQSPGALPNTITLEAMRAGMRYARNQTLVNVMRDYRYVDARGMGVKDKVIPGMRDHNGTEPDLFEEHQRFIVRLWKGATGEGGAEAGAET
jgi:ATP-dependent DNA helicase RecG